MFKVNTARISNLIKAGKNTRLGEAWPGRRCGAKTRAKTSCKNPVVNGKTRCRMHGGKSTGPQTKAGKERVVAAHFKHGRRSKSSTAEIAKIWAELRAVEERMRADGMIE